MTKTTVDLSRSDLRQLCGARASQQIIDSFDVVFMSTETLRSLRPSGKLGQTGRGPRFWIYEDKLILTSDDIEPGKVLDSVPAYTKQKIRKRFLERGWTIPAAIQ